MIAIDIWGRKQLEGAVENRGSKKTDIACMHEWEKRASSCVSCVMHYGV